MFGEEMRLRLVKIDLFYLRLRTHTYLNKNDNASILISVEQVFKEGRKFGLGALVISQRPSEISETILDSVGNFIALR
jgi:DNA helicase HerA-like ATPase